MAIKILFVGDVFGRPGRRALKECLPPIRDKEQIDLVVVNGENSAGGKGITPKICDEFFAIGVDVITNGNHVMEKKEISDHLASDPRMLRPLNLPASVPGRGTGIFKTPSGTRVAVINAIGKVQMREENLHPFGPLKAAVDEMKSQTPVVIVDFHAEATSEKRAMGWFLDGSVTALVGTHTHVATADEEILPKGTAYITDVGMTGPYDSVIGLRTDLALERFLTGKRHRFDVGKGDVRFSAVLIEADEITGKATAISRLRMDLG